MRVMVFAGGDPVPPEVVGSLTAPDLVVAADSGAATARAAGITIDHLVGDFDSITEPDHIHATADGAMLHPHPTDKDATDLELALELATDLGATELVVVGGHGGRLDHLLANAALLAAERWPAPLTWLAGADRVEIVRGRRSIEAPVGATVTILAASSARGVEASGLRWELAGVGLEPGSTRGVSNEVVSSPFTIAAAGGTLAVILPNGAG